MCGRIRSDTGPFLMGAAVGFICFALFTAVLAAVAW